MTSICSALTGEQVDAYFERVQLPKTYRRDQHPALDLSFLSNLQGYHVTAIPYENLSLHYAKNVKVSLDVAELHKKLVRLHSVNIVTLDQQRYLIDVGYGGNGPRCPLPLVKGSIHKNIGTQTMRLVYEPLPGSRQRQWIYQTRNAEDQPFFTSCHSDCFLTSHLLVVKYLRERDEVYGEIVLDDDKVKKNQGGKNVLVQMCMTERERVKALKDQFGIELTEEEQKGIQGRMSALAMSDC
ncbi:hypothetical protein BDV27DRAFT_169138 [Aspergillus caelatus]|uniref:Uncharacterized protein n=1 Tax=Aspergillus caelatus TaxID=61420 RepID=A0A5N6ZPR9_9EURO|nr:uncharacterized protein BDV27DRAFT_169138 [Aspergillus caelatus]KAE8358849.1 hypothetical protein BDV27DRAFT_169138 [Aspergillus caelatus]